MVRPTLLPSPILATATCRLFEFYSFLSRTSARFPSLTTQPSHFHSLRRSPDVFLPSLRTRRRITSLRLTLKFSLSLTMAPYRSVTLPSLEEVSLLSLLHAFISPTLSLCLIFFLSLSFSHLNVFLLSKYLAETRVCLSSVSPLSFSLSLAYS